MKSKDFLLEGFVEDASDVHLDHEVQMAREECYHAAEHALAIHKLLRNISEQQGLEGWVSSKITLANDYLNTVREHLEYELLQPQIDDVAIGLPIAENNEQGVAEGSDKNVIKSVKVGNFRHDLVDTGMGWQVRIYNGDELYDTGMSKNSEQKGLAALEDAVAYTEKQTRTKRQGLAEDSLNEFAPTKSVGNFNRGGGGTGRGGDDDRNERDDSDDEGIINKILQALERLQPDPFETYGGEVEDVVVNLVSGGRLDDYIRAVGMGNIPMKELIKQGVIQTLKELKELYGDQGVAEGSSFQTDQMVSHISQIIKGLEGGGDKNTYMKLVAREMPHIVQSNPKLFRRAFGIAYDRFFHIDQDDDFDYTDDSMRQGEKGIAKGMDVVSVKEQGVAEGKKDPDELSRYENDVKTLLANGDIKTAKKVAGLSPDAAHRNHLRNIIRHYDSKQGVAEGDVIQGPWSGMNRPEPGERYAIVRTRPDGTRDFAAGHFDSWQKAKQELQKFLKHELHTELGHQFEIVKKKGVAEAAKCNQTMEGTKCPVHGLKECPGMKARALAEWRKAERAKREVHAFNETTAGSVAGVVNPTSGKPKSKIGSLFGGTYKQQKKKA